MSGDNPQQPTPSAEEASTAVPATASAAKARGKSKPDKPPRRGAAGWLALLALLVAIAALAVSGWLYREQYLLPQAPDPAVTSLKNSLAQVQQQQQSLQSSLESQRESLAQLRSDQQQQLSALLNRSQTLETRVDKLSSVDRKDWLIAEAEYLLRLANQRLQMGRDARAAAKLLASADEVLAQVDDAGLHNVRAELAREMAALQGVAQFDIEGAYLRLEGLAEALESLTLFDPPSYEAEAPPPVDSTWQDRFASGLRRAWEKLRSYIRIRHREENFEPVLAPEHEAALRYSLQLMVEQAQMALLAERPELYQRSLSQAREWLQKYYERDAALKAQLATIAELQALPLERELPDISASLAALKTFIDSRRWQQEVQE